MKSDTRITAEKAVTALIGLIVGASVLLILFSLVGCGGEDSYLDGSGCVVTRSHHGPSRIKPEIHLSDVMWQCGETGYNAVCSSFEGKQACTCLIYKDGTETYDGSQISSTDVIPSDPVSFVLYVQSYPECATWSPPFM